MCVLLNSLRFRFFVHSGADFRFFVRISCVNSEHFSKSAESSFFRAVSDLKVNCVFVLSCGKRYIPISNSLFRFRFQLRFPFPLHFPIPVPLPLPLPWPAPGPLRPAPSPNLITPRRIVIIRRRFDDIANYPAIPDSSSRARAQAASPRQINAKRNNTKSDIIFEENAEKKRKTEKYCENARKYGNVRGEYMPPENLKNVKVAARKIGRGV